MDENEEFFKKNPNGQITLRSGSYAKLKKQILKENSLNNLSDTELVKIHFACRMQGNDEIVEKIDEELDRRKELAKREKRID